MLKTPELPTNPRVEDHLERLCKIQEYLYTHLYLLGKHVPLDGRYREPVDPKTGTDRSRPIGKDTYVNMPKSHICINLT